MMKKRNPRSFEVGAGIGMNLFNCSIRYLSDQ